MNTNGVVDGQINLRCDGGTWYKATIKSHKVNLTVWGRSNRSEKDLNKKRDNLLEDMMFYW